MQGKEEAFDIAATQEQISVEDQVLAEQQIAVEDQIPVKDQVVVEHQAPAEGEHSMGGQYVKPPIADKGECGAKRQSAAASGNSFAASANLEKFRG